MKAGESLLLTSQIFVWPSQIGQSNHLGDGHSPSEQSLSDHVKDRQSFDFLSVDPVDNVRITVQQTVVRQPSAIITGGSN